MAGGVVLLGYEHLGEPDIAHVEHAVGALRTQKASDVDRAGLVFGRVRSAALDPTESLTRIEEAAARLRRAEATVDLTQAQWRTSSYSGTNGASCVEVAFLPGEVAVRDTKDRTRPPQSHSPAAWRAFVAAVRAGRFGS
ncbi:DUF397 domain-containing protein [Pseudonocardia sp. S2-4]|uniref:DUF397 domain-containing protein n=2 Tax=Pseudonocardia humida TaxID=2800819 RepID=A0ABT0ZT92_9PSEU|nr:DUF397 domain-containing protein [Pseudonocardia humida]